MWYYFSYKIVITRNQLLDGVVSYNKVETFKVN